MERLYERYNRREFVYPDPVGLLYEYDEAREREVAGLIASSLAYGRAKQILASAARVLSRMGPSPRRFVQSASEKRLNATFAHFRHRFTTGEEIAAILLGVKQVIQRYGSLEACFEAGLRDDDDTVAAALCEFADKLTANWRGQYNTLLPKPKRGSACKRLNLFLRWMARRDEVDPGGWDNVPTSKLIVPLDTHMHRISVALGLTAHKQASMRSALEITAAFRQIAPEDPVRFDFALTRLGIRGDADMTGFLEECLAKEVGRCA